MNIIKERPDKKRKVARRSLLVMPDLVDQKDVHVGDEAHLNRGILSLSELYVNTEDHRVLLPEACGNGKANTEKMAEIMFESFNIPAICMVVDSGDGVSDVMLVYEGDAISNTVNKLWERVVEENGEDYLEDIRFEALTMRSYSS
ncbi:actin [Tanacetum coccineum]